MTTQQHLAQARALPLPPREATLQRAASVMQFWEYQYQPAGTGMAAMGARRSRSAAVAR